MPQKKNKAINQCADTTDYSQNSANESASQTLLDFIGDIYEAALNPDNWDNVIETLCQLTGSKSSVLVIQDQQTGVNRITSMHGISRLITLAYNAGLGKYDNTFSLIKTPLNDVMVLNKEELIRNTPSFTQFIMKPADIGHMLAVELHRDGKMRIGLAVHRGFNAEPFDAEASFVLRQIAPHICRSALISEELRSARQQALDISSLLENMPFGTLITDASGHIKYHNAIARHMFDSHEAIALKDEQIQLFNRSYQQQLIAALAKQAADQQAVTSPDVISVSHPAYSYPLVIFVGRGNQTADPERISTASAEPGAISIYLCDPGSALVLTSDRIALAFNLTAAEAEVALSLVNGLKLADIAENKSVGIETVRSQVKNIFHKLGVNKQQEVVRMIVQTLLPVADSGSSAAS